MYLENENIPLQVKGSQTDMIQHIRLDSESDAEELYNTAKLRLLNMWNWSKIADGPSSEFELTDSTGHPVYRPAQCGDKFKIDLTAAGIIAGFNDWVEIVSIEDEFDPFENIAVTAITVKATNDPTKYNDQSPHFFTNDATNTFLVRRIGQVVSVEIHGRNEIVKSIGMRILHRTRHYVGKIAAHLGFPMSEWKRLAKGLLGVQNKALAKQHTMLVNSHKAVA